MPVQALSINHPDYETLAPIVETILDRAGGYYEFIASVSQLIRTAIDEVIDAPRTIRFTLGEVEKTEKTYLGTKIEILLRWHLGLPKGKKLDLRINDTEVDIKNTMGNSWSIPQENVGYPAILIRSNEQIAKFDFGMIVIKESYLNPGKNRDGKRAISSAAVAQNVWWILREQPYPENFWEQRSEAERSGIMEAGGGAQRVATLFERYQNQPISRSVVEAVSKQKDYMKRIRRKGGARDILAPRGIAILWGRGDRELINQLNLGRVEDDEFISFRPEAAEEINLLKKRNHID